MGDPLRSNARNEKVHPAAPAGSGGAGYFRSAQPLGIGPRTPESKFVGLYPLLYGPYKGTRATMVVSPSEMARLAEAIRLAIPKLPVELRDKVLSLLTPEALGIMTGMAAVWGGSHFIGIGEGVDLILMGVGTIYLGRDAIQAGGDFANFARIATRAESEEDLDRAADHFARALAIIGVDGLLVIIARASSKSFGKAGGPRTAFEEGMGSDSDTEVSRMVRSKAVTTRIQPQAEGLSANIETGSARQRLSLGTDESWGNPQTLARHFRDHGGDFGASSADDYTQQASEFLQRSQMEGLPTKVGGDGVIRVYDPSSNAFGSYNPDGTARTFYKPNPEIHGYPTNLDYWNSQNGGPPWSP